VGIACRDLGIDKALGSAAATLVGDDDRLLHQLVLGDDRLHDTGEVVRTAAGAGRDDELDLFRGLPIGVRRSRECHCNRSRNQP
jgi:hypothetical protein